MSHFRQLAAIMFTDIVGYTALMGNNEQNALGILKKNRELQIPIIEQFKGRFIKELGDGTVSLIW
jgi:adenylate cyclase